MSRGNTFEIVLILIAANATLIHSAGGASTSNQKLSDPSANLDLQEGYFELQLIQDIRLDSAKMLPVRAQKLTYYGLPETTNKYELFVQNGKPVSKSAIVAGLPVCLITGAAQARLSTPTERVSLIDENGQRAYTFPFQEPQKIPMGLKMRLLAATTRAYAPEFSSAKISSWGDSNTWTLTLFPSTRDLDDSTRYRMTAAVAPYTTLSLFSKFECGIAKRRPDLRIISGLPKEVSITIQDIATALGAKLL
jgi:hypothetical protein